MPKTDAEKREANAEMVEGYKDGWDENNPEPSANRSRSYRHGFRRAREDRGAAREFATLEQTQRAANDAMAADETDRMFG